jgi:hypothetical protein
MVDLKAAIAKQREKLETVTQYDVTVACGGEEYKVSVERATPDEWDDLVNSNPPRPGVEGDALIGYNPKGVARSYPRVQVDGEPVDAETWGEFFDVLESLHKNNIGLVIWNANVYVVLQELRELGKARAGKK